MSFRRAALAAATAVAVTLGFAAAALPAAAQETVQDQAQDQAQKGAADDPGQVVNCYDRSRDLVTRMLRWQCKGRVIDDAAARAVRERRILRTKRMLSPAKPLYPKLRMVSSGTGFFISRQGDMLTNNHVVKGCVRMSARPLHEQNHQPATVVATDVIDDLAVIRYSGVVPAVARFQKPLTLAAGDRIAVIGYPLLGRVAIRPIFVTGQVRAIDTEDLRRWGRFEIHADVRHGNSGGPVIDARGYVVGVVSAKVNTPAMYQRTGEVLRDIGLIIRESRVLRFLGRNDIAYESGHDRPVLDDDGLYRMASGFVARVGCWK